MIAKSLRGSYGILIVIITLIMIGNVSL